MNINFNDPLSVLIALHNATETTLGTLVSPQHLEKVVSDILEKKHKTLYEERIRHLPPLKLMEIFELSKKSKKELEEMKEKRELEEKLALAKQEEQLLEEQNHERPVEVAIQAEEKEQNTIVRASENKQQSGKQKKGKARH